MELIRVGILGGKLQGVEACYLARRAGYRITVFDRDPHCAAAELADRFVCADLLRTDVRNELARCDFVLPAMENLPVIERMADCARALGVPYLYDREAYRISSSKRRSDRFFRAHGIPCPRYYPESGFPVILKPSALSGSAGVRKIGSRAQLTQAMWGRQWQDYVIQEYLEGPSYSIEVIGDGTACVPLAVTRIVTDGDYDCCRVEAGMPLPPDARRQMCEIGKTIGEALHIRGIFDVETIYSGGKMYVLEIDARLPSQTPTAVLQATGVNMLELLWDAARGRLRQPQLPEKQHVIYQHIAVCGTEIAVRGEHIMAQAGRLHYCEDFFGCPEALTSFRPGKREWAATLIMRDAHSLEGAQRKLQWTLERIRQYMKEDADGTAIYYHTRKRVI